MKKKTHTAEVYNTSGDTAASIGMIGRIALHETKHFWIDSKGKRYDKQYGYRAGGWHKIDLGTIRPIVEGEKVVW
jgi:hypothetical protein